MGTAGFGTVPGATSYTVMSLLAKELATGHGVIADEPTLYDIGIKLYGLRIRDRMRIMALDALNYLHGPNAPTKENYMIPVGLWGHKAFESAPWCDPYEYVVPSERRDDIAWEGLCRFLGIQVHEGLDLDADARQQAEIARQITLKCGLVCR